MKHYEYDEEVVFSSSSRVDRSAEGEHKCVSALEVTLHTCFCTLALFFLISQTTMKSSWFWAATKNGRQVGGPRICLRSPYQTLLQSTNVTVMWNRHLSFLCADEDFDTVTFFYLIPSYPCCQVFPYAICNEDEIFISKGTFWWLSRVRVQRTHAHDWHFTWPVFVWCHQVSLFY